jgi:hypothetical protein
VDTGGSWPPARQRAVRVGICRHRRPLHPHHRRHAEGEAGGRGEGWGGRSSATAPERWKERREERKVEAIEGEEGGGDCTRLASCSLRRTRSGSPATLDFGVSPEP